MSQPSLPLKIGPWGGHGANSFDIVQFPLPISEVKLYTGYAVNGLEITYVDGKAYLAGGKVGGLGAFKLEAGDYIKEVTGSSKEQDGQTIVTQLEFKTKSGKHYGPFGQAGADKFTVPVEAGKIVGFFGQYSSYINSIGVSLGPN